jgi:hypothetical protein
MFLNTKVDTASEIMNINPHPAKKDCHKWLSLWCLRDTKNCQSVVRISLCIIDENVIKSRTER